MKLFPDLKVLMSGECGCVLAHSLPAYSGSPARQTPPPAGLRLSGHAGRQISAPVCKPEKGKVRSAPRHGVGNDQRLMALHLGKDVAQHVPQSVDVFGRQPVGFERDDPLPMLRHEAFGIVAVRT